MEVHSHSNQHNARSKSRLAIALGIVLAVLVVEIVGGLLSNSLSLMGDAAHMLVDALALGLALFATSIAGRPATSEKTYGFHRAEIIAALVNGMILILVALFILYQAYQRFINPPQIKAPIMLIVAVIGLVANVFGMFLLRGKAKTNLNLKAAFWHIVGDTISSLGVIAAAAVIYTTGFDRADAIIAVLITGIILWGAYGLIRESINILLESVPKNLKRDDVVTALVKIDGVMGIHDMHIWTITSGFNSLSAHIVIEDQMVSNCQGITQRINDMLRDKFNIIHTTLQLECGNCVSGSVCSLSPAEENEHNKVSTDFR